MLKRNTPEEIEAIVKVIKDNLTEQTAKDKADKYIRRLADVYYFHTNEDRTKAVLSRDDNTLNQPMTLLSFNILVTDVILPRNPHFIYDLAEVLPVGADIEILTAEPEHPYNKLLQSKGTNALQHASPKAASVDMQGKATITYDGVTIEIEDYTDKTLDTATRRVLDILVEELTRQIPNRSAATIEKLNKCRLVEITLKDYMTKCGISDPKTARKQLNESIEKLYKVSLTWTERRSYTPEGKTRRVTRPYCWKARIINAYGGDGGTAAVTHGRVSVLFDLAIVEHYAEAYIMPYPANLYKVSIKNAHAYAIGRKLVEHHNMNIAKPNAGRISVKALTAACPDLPRYEEVMSKSKAVTQRIIEPFERDLNALITARVLTEWHYCNPKGEPLSDEQITDYSYSEWITWLIEFDLLDYPDQSERLAEIEERRKKAAKRKKTAKKTE